MAPYRSNAKFLSARKCFHRSDQLYALSISSVFQTCKLQPAVLFSPPSQITNLAHFPFGWKSVPQKASFSLSLSLSPGSNMCLLHVSRWFGSNSIYACGEHLLPSKIETNIHVLLFFFFSMYFIGSLTHAVIFPQDYNDEIRQEQLRELSLLNGSEESNRGRSAQARSARPAATATVRWDTNQSRWGGGRKEINNFTSWKLYKKGRLKISAAEALRLSD